MKFATKGAKSTVIYNDHITLRNIPPAAYEYIVNGKPALEWFIEQQMVTKDLNAKGEGSGIANDANRYATEPVGDPATHSTSSAASPPSPSKRCAL